MTLCVRVDVVSTSQPAHPSSLLKFLAPSRKAAKFFELASGLRRAPKILGTRQKADGPKGRNCA